MKIFIAATILRLASAFLIKPASFRTARHVLNLEDDIADLIDKQLWRQNHKSEVEAEWRQRQAAVLEKELPSGFEFDDHMMEDIVSPRESRKDKLLAKKNPAAYCADRCLATGNCDVFEDILELSAMEVLAFCSDCVLGEGEEPCNVPEAAFDKLLP